MKKNLMFFALGVSTTLLMGAGISYWNEIRQENKYGVLVNSVGSRSFMDYNYVPDGNKYGVLVNSLGSRSFMDYNYVPDGNRYGVLVNSPQYNDYIPNDNKYALVLEGEIGDDAQKAMVVGFIHGLAIGRKETKYVKEEGADSNSNSRFKKSLFEDSRFKKSL